jgi:Xaa-Pro aminopeptidase
MPTSNSTETTLSETFPEVKAFENAQAIDMIREAAQITEALLDEFAATALHPGVTEHQLEETLKAMAEERHAGVQWHKPYVRFGENTLLTYRDKSTENLVLQESDICFVDFGPVCEIDYNDQTYRFEGDVGKTWVIGEPPAPEHVKIQTAAQLLFDLGQALYAKESVTGIELYAWLEREAERMGYVCNLPDAGHLIGEFPHFRWKSGLANYPDVPAPGCWIFEVQIRHPERSIGAFIENILG